MKTLRPITGPRSIWANAPKPSAAVLRAAKKLEKQPRTIPAPPAPRFAHYDILTAIERASCRGVLDDPDLLAPAAQIGLAILCQDHIVPELRRRFGDRAEVEVTRVAAVVPEAERLLELLKRGEDDGTKERPGPDHGMPGL